jgi:hypothetical protein
VLWQALEKSQWYSNCHAELVSASNEFNISGDSEIVDPDPETSSG